jgi:hypothetical protein
MTFRVNFYAEQAFLSFVKKSIDNPSSGKDEIVENGAMCVIACVASIESFVNSLLKQDGRFRHFDELKLGSKIETLADFGGIEIDSGSQPWQHISRLIRVRNWLVHYKDSDIGLINSAGEWIIDDLNKYPKIDPDIDLSILSIRKFYNSTRQILIELAKGLQIDSYFYEFLDTENYEAFQVG